MTVSSIPRSIGEAVDALQRGELSAVELIGAALETIDRLDRRLNAFAAVKPAEILLAEASRVDRRRRSGEMLGPLAGIPIGLKDVYLTRDLPTTASSKVLDKNPASADATVVSKLRDAGAIVVGKTQTHEFAYGPTTVNEYAGPSRNPWNPDHVPGGSSGGSAIAVATGMCLGATGTDTGGSIRTPSAFCGVTGLKPTFGLVSRYGVLSLAWSLDHAGPIGRTVNDLALLLQVIAGFDHLDTGSVKAPIPDYAAEARKKPAPMRIGIPREHFFDVIDPEVRASFESSIAVFRSFGWTVDEVSIPHLRYALGSELAILSAEASSYHRERMRLQADDFSSDVRQELDAGMVILATDYLLGQRVRRVILGEFVECFRKVDVLATPTIPIPAPRIGETVVRIGGRDYSLLDAIWRNVYPSNLTGSPTICFPCGFSKARFPLSLQLIGRHFDEVTLLRAGYQFQLETDFHQQVPPA